MKILSAPAPLEEWVMEAPLYLQRGYGAPLSPDVHVVFCLEEEKDAVSVSFICSR